MFSALTCDLYLQAAQVVLIALFELNTPEFTMLLGALPKTFQDGATKLLHNHLKNSSNTSSGVVSPAKFPWYVMSDRGRWKTLFPFVPASALGLQLKINE